MPAVKGTQILLVEDDYYLAVELGRYFTELGALVLGPVPSIERAQDFLETTDAAILDVHLAESDIFPFADELLRRCVPFIFYTGGAETDIPLRFRHIACLQKPARPVLLLQALTTPGELVGPAQQGSSRSVMDAIPLLRLAARLHVGDERAADRLVEQTLRRALFEVDLKPGNASVQEWLGRLLVDVYDEQGSKLMN